MTNSEQSALSVNVKTQYLPEQSNQADNQFVFSYTITITNNSEVSAKLLRRRWVITDSNGDESIVEGEGVIGQQPVIKPGNKYTYTSGSVFNTPVGTMHGHYQMIDNNQNTFWVDIPVFRLALPNILN
ncbi:Co2+/Mg2+ efflux protein ApaG [Thalassotalea sp. M1531]|uniref:Protein ApaG n=1 Tax=Thalassotalea algicola TaxID=2716224 RepID=A0A7Y0L9A4_9GAMM|nr:Co2+/Mg2+ efflux protein ApaG [Thalassotalea algicola]NMP30313.1 Co2+/Mg2+ efflux protein ApaG [Thalassotalea algicola]